MHSNLDDAQGEYISGKGRRQKKMACQDLNINKQAGSTLFTESSCKRMVCIKIKFTLQF